MIKFIDVEEIRDAWNQYAALLSGKEGEFTLTLLDLKELRRGIEEDIEALDELLQRKDDDLPIGETRADLLARRQRVFHEALSIDLILDGLRRGERPRLIPSSEISKRGLTYLRAVVNLKNKPVNNFSQYFAKIAGLSPKANGTMPDRRAPWDWFKSNGFLRDSEAFMSFRERIEREALAYLNELDGGNGKIKD